MADDDTATRDGGIVIAGVDSFYRGFDTGYFRPPTLVRARVDDRPPLPLTELQSDYVRRRLVPARPLVGPLNEDGLFSTPGDAMRLAEVHRSLQAAGDEGVEYLEDIRTYAVYVENV